MDSQVMDGDHAADEDQTQHSGARAPLRDNVLALAQRSLASASESMLAFVGPEIDHRAALLAASKTLAAASDCFRAAAELVVVGHDSLAPAQHSQQISSGPAPGLPQPSSAALVPQKRTFSQRSEVPPVTLPHHAAIDGPANHTRQATPEPPTTTTARSNEDYLAQILPHEIKEMIYEHFDLDAWRTIRVVCRSWNNIATPHLFGQVYLHRCAARRDDFDVFMRLCTKPLRQYIRRVRLCAGHCDSPRDLQAPSTVVARSGRTGPAPRPDTSRSMLSVEDEENLENDYLSFIRSVDTLHIKSRFIKDKPTPISRNMGTLFFGNLVGLSSLTISHSDLFDLLGHDSPKTDGLLGHVLFPRLRFLHLESTTGRMVHLTSLLLPHASTLRVLHLDRLFLESHDWRTFFRELGSRYVGQFHLDEFAMRVGRTKLFQDGASWQPLVTQALGIGNITPSTSEPPKRFYVNGFDWARQAG